MPYKYDDGHDWEGYQGYDYGGDDLEALMKRLTASQKSIQSTIMDEINKTATRITQTATEIRQEVWDIQQGLESSITQTADEIRQEVWDMEQGLQSQLTIQAGLIASKVSSTDYNGQTIVSLIEQSPESIKLTANKIDFTGLATFRLGQDSAGYLTIEGSSLYSGNQDTVKFSSITHNRIMVYDYLQFSMLNSNKLSFTDGHFESWLSGRTDRDGTNQSHTLELYSPDWLEIEANIIDFKNSTIQNFNLPSNSIPFGTGYSNVARGNHTHSEYSPTGHNHGNTYVQSEFGNNISLSTDGSVLSVRRNGQTIGILTFD